MLFTERVPEQALGLLKRLMTYDFLSPVSLVGGTSLALRYGHRTSIDLDMFSTETVDLELLLNRLSEVEEVRQSTLKPYMLVLYVGETKVDFVKHAYKLISPTETVEGIRMFSVPDVCAMKLAAISSRGAKKDFYDLFEMLQHFSTVELLNWFSYKYDHYNVFHVMKALTYFDDAENSVGKPEVVYAKPGYPSWSEIKSFIVKEVNKYSDI